MTPEAFAAKWRPVALSERAACQSHFNDLCAVVGQPTPIDADPTGEWFTFEKGVTKSTGGQGFADVWKRGCFGWEYKKKRKDLGEAYRQLCQYREALENPPLLVVCDLDRFEVHTNFPNTVKRVHQFDLAGMGEPKNLAVLRRAFSDPEKLHPRYTQEQLTAEVAGRFGALADGMRGRGVDPQTAGRFLVRLLFCLFAEDVELIPSNLFSDTVAECRTNPTELADVLGELFRAMDAGKRFGRHKLDRFNGRLFANADALPLTLPEIDVLLDVGRHDWSGVDPSIFGTLFERVLNPAKRRQFGAHFTRRTDIDTLLESVLVAPLRREWAAVRAEADRLWAKAVRTKAKSKARVAFEATVRGFQDRLAGVTVLDPACGSGNFLYVALYHLMALEKEILTYEAERTGQMRFPLVRPDQLRGIEIDPHARELAAVVVWIGYLQWMRANGFDPDRNPVLSSTEAVREGDAVLDLSDPSDPRESEWPAAEFIVGNPPFLGGNRVRATLGNEYVDRLFTVFGDRIPNFSDLCCYWVEKSRGMVKAGRSRRVGLVATQSIRGGANREVIHRVKGSGDLFFAISDQDWVLEGASVHVSMIGFDDGTQTDRTLDGAVVEFINPNLTSDVDVTRAQTLATNVSLHVEGVKKGADFELSESTVAQVLSEPNVHGRPNSDVIRLYRNGAELVNERDPGWIIYYPTSMCEADACPYESPFKLVTDRVFPKYGSARKRWWIHERPRADLVAALDKIDRYLCVVKHAKHRIFAWVPAVELVSNAIEAFPTDDDYMLGLLHSRIHGTWAFAAGTQVRERESGFRYTPTTCFETFPFPEPFAALRAEIAAAAAELDRLRSAWLNPPEWTRTEILTFPGSADGPWRRYVSGVDPATGVGTVRYPRTVPRDAATAAQLKGRTLTALYNKPPTWLTDAHRKLDELVAAAYGWKADRSDDEVLAGLLALNLQRAADGPDRPRAVRPAVTGRTEALAARAAK